MEVWDCGNAFGAEFDKPSMACVLDVLLIVFQEKML